MLLSDLKYNYPEDLIAVSPQRPSRVMWVDDQGQPSEITIQDLIGKIPSGDVLVLNDTKVLKRRVFIKHPFDQNEEIEILFLMLYQMVRKKFYFHLKNLKSVISCLYRMARL